MEAFSLLPSSFFTELPSRGTSFYSKGGLHLSNMCNKVGSGILLVLAWGVMFGFGGPLGGGPPMFGFLLLSIR